MVALGFVSHETSGEVGRLEDIFHALMTAIGWKAWRWARHVLMENVLAAGAGLAGAAALFSLVIFVWAILA
jgi:hypothetical protein